MPRQADLDEACRHFADGPTADVNGSDGMAARYRSGYLVPSGVERSLTQKPWRPGTPSPGSIPHPKFNPMDRPPALVRAVPVLYRGIERSAGLQGFDQATVQARLRMLLNEGKPGH